MVFSSFEFLLLFLPIIVSFYYILGKLGYKKYCLPFLICGSFFYYAYWNPIYITLIAISIVINYTIAQKIIICHKSKMSYLIQKKVLFGIGMLFNLGLLTYFKYVDFFINTVNLAVGSNFELQYIALPIGISFYTFQQIAYLSDIYTNRYPDLNENFVNYILFVIFFPQLIAGPIVHHSEMMPQFTNKVHIVNWKNMYTGLCFLSMGLAKKVIIADTLAPIVKFAFDTTENLTFLEAIYAALTYTMQLYMDFSGYADMAIGCALLFNIQLPYNFNSPYKSLDIQDFWRRWHITLSRWLRDYIYIPLGGNRVNSSRTLLNIFITFLIGGLWHGANWTFVLWGILHGIALIIHRLWLCISTKRLPSMLAWAITFSFTMLAWIPFRALNFDRLHIFTEALSGKTGLMIRISFGQGIVDAYNYPSIWLIVPITTFLCLTFLITIFTKNSQNLITHFDKKIFIFYINILLIISLLTLIAPNYQPDFIYFQF